MTHLKLRKPIRIPWELVFHLPTVNQELYQGVIQLGPNLGEIYKQFELYGLNLRGLPFIAVFGVAIPTNSGPLTIVIMTPVNLSFNDPSTVYLRTPIPFIRGSNRNPNHRAPNHQLTISWLKWSHLFAQPTGIFIPLRPCWRLELQAVGPCARCQARPGVVRGQRWPVGLCRREGAVVSPMGFGRFGLRRRNFFLV